MNQYLQFLLWIYGISAACYIANLIFVRTAIREVQSLRSFALWKPTGRSSSESVERVELTYINTADVRSTYHVHTLEGVAQFFEEHPHVPVIDAVHFNPGEEA